MLFHSCRCDVRVFAIHKEKEKVTSRSRKNAQKVFRYTILKKMRGLKQVEGKCAQDALVAKYIANILESALI